MNNPDILLTYFLRKLENTSDNIDLLEDLKSSNLLTSDFEERYILNNDVRYFRETVKKEYKSPLMSYFLNASDGMPYKIELLQDVTWKIKSFLFQCMGVLENMKGVLYVMELVGESINKKYPLSQAL